MQFEPDILQDIKVCRYTQAKQKVHLEDKSVNITQKLNMLTT